MRSVLPPSSSTSTGLQTATWRRSLTWTTSRIRLRSSTTVDGKDVRLTTGVTSPNPVQRDILPHRHSQLSDLTIRLCSTTLLKSISLKRWLYHQMFKLSSDQFNSPDANHVISHSSFWLVNRLTADQYTQTLDERLHGKSIMDNRWQQLSFNAKLARS